MLTLFPPHPQTFLPQKGPLAAAAVAWGLGAGGRDLEEEQSLPAQRVQPLVGVGGVAVNYLMWNEILPSECL